MERVKGKKWAILELAQSCSDGKDPMSNSMTRTERQGEEPQQLIMSIRSRIMPTFTQGPLEVAAQEPSSQLL